MFRAILALSLLLLLCSGCAATKKVLAFFLSGDDETMIERDQREAEAEYQTEQKNWIEENQSGAYKPIR